MRTEVGNDREDDLTPESEERAKVRIGCAGWSIPSTEAASFGAGPSHLARYSMRFDAVEIDTSFYRPHRPATYRHWAESVPDGFKFAVKVPRTITHEHRLADCGHLLDTFLGQCGELGPALGPLLLQLPPSLKFDEAVVSTFLRTLRERFSGAIVCEPRHASWFSGADGEGKADALLAEHRIARVAADPAVVPSAAQTGGWDSIVYYRLHGSPHVYYSAYEDAALDALARKLRAVPLGATAWCIFDNSAAGAAISNALHLQERLESV